jgi:nucleoside transporter
MNSNRFKLSVMMFLQYVIWGAWLPLLTKYLTEFLKFSGVETAWIQNTFALASVAGMLLGGQLADRYFAQEKFLALSHLIGGITMFLLSFQTSFWPFFALMLIHCLFYVPTLSVTNAIAFANLKDAQKDFGFIRVWGTIGWIAASWPFVFILLDWAAVPSMDEAGGFMSWLGTALATSKSGPALHSALTNIFTVAGGASLVLAAFCLTLPHTPPAKKQGQEFAPWKAFKLLAVPSILVLFTVTFLDSLVHYCYFFWTGSYLTSIGLPANWTSPAMSVGQIAEIPTMALLGFALKKLGWRKTMVIGIFGQVVRYLIYAFGTRDLLWLVIGSNVVHGFCYAFFFASVYIYVDKNFPADVRTSAQGLFNVLILGLGPFLSNLMSGKLGDVFKTGEAVNYNKVFLVPLGIALFAAAFFLLFFHPPREGIEPAMEGAPLSQETA